MSDAAASDSQGSSKDHVDPPVTDQAKSEDEAQGKNDDNSRFECNICLDTARDAVVSHCGHLFCWPCLVQWLDTRPTNQVCPVCKALISRDNVIPLYGRGGNNSDPRDKVPPRPRGQRQEAPQGFAGFNWGEAGGQGGGMHFSFGIGLFPFSMLAPMFSFNWEGNRPEPPQPGSQQHNEEQFLSNLFFYIGLLFVLWLIIL